MSGLVKLINPFSVGIGAYGKTVQVDGCLLQDYKSFKIVKLPSSYILIMKGVIVTETVGRLGCIMLANAIEGLDMLRKNPLDIASDYHFKLVTAKKHHEQSLKQSLKKVRA